MILRDAAHELMSVAATTGDTALRGDLTVGGTAVGSVTSSVVSTPGAAWLPRTALDLHGRFKTTAELGQGSFHVCFATKAERLEHENTMSWKASVSVDGVVMWWWMWQESGGAQSSDFVSLQA